MSKICLRVLVSGRVQGVWYRQSTQQEARRIGVTGWVSNLPDGRVEALLSGDQTSVEVLLEWMHQGPPQADVKAVEFEVVEDPKTHHSFSIER